MYTSRTEPKIYLRFLLYVALVRKILYDAIRKTPCPPHSVNSTRQPVPMPALGAGRESPAVYTNRHCTPDCLGSFLSGLPCRVSQKSRGSDAISQTQTLGDRCYAQRMTSSQMRQLPGVHPHPFLLKHDSQVIRWTGIPVGLRLYLYLQYNQ